MKDDMISRQAALKGLEDLNIASFYELDEHSKEAYTEVKAMLKDLPSAQSEHLCTVMERIKEKYAKAMNTPCIHNPMAWALYQVWKEYDK